MIIAFWVSSSPAKHWNFSVAVMTLDFWHSFLPPHTLTSITGLEGMYPLSNCCKYFSCTSYCCLNGSLSLILFFFMQLVMPGEEGSVTTLLPQHAWWYSVPGPFHYRFINLMTWDEKTMSFTQIIQSWFLTLLQMQPFPHSCCYCSCCILRYSFNIVL